MSTTFKIEPDEIVQVNNKKFKITHVLSLSQVLGTDIKSGESIKLPISQIEPVKPEVAKKTRLLDREVYKASDEDWKEVDRKIKIIQPLVNLGNERSKEDVEKVADENGVGIATVYRWLANYELTGKPSSLLRLGRSDRGKGRLSNEVEAVISTVIEDFYLTENKPTIAATYERLSFECYRQGLEVPSLQTLNRRIRKLMPYKVDSSRLGREAMRNYTVNREQYSEAKTPLSVVQIDHTPVDLMFVDEKFRKPVGRAWLTVAIDVFSRCVCGFYLSYDPPSAASVGFALAHSILPKEKFLAKHGVSEKWDIWGKMTTIHADNGSDFRCEMLNRVIRDYRMHINWRPKSKPNYGGHIERLLGTFNNDIHTLPGSTFSNIQERGRYNSEKKAAFTLAEFEKWLSIYITKIYHHKIHSTINMPPIAKYEESILGTDETPPVGHPPRFDDEIRLKLDFLPGVERSVQRYGVAINNLFYFHPLINKYINLRADETTKSKRKFLVKQDPRDITVAYFFDDFTNEYITLTLAERTIESMSLADLKMVKKALKQKGLEAVNQQTIFSGYQDTLNLTDEVIEKTKSARRNSQKRVDSKRKNKEYFAEESFEAVADEKSKKDLFSKNYEGFSDMEFD